MLVDHNTPTILRPIYEHCFIRSYFGDGAYRYLDTTGKHRSMPPPIGGALTSAATTATTTTTSSTTRNISLSLKNNHTLLPCRTSAAAKYESSDIRPVILAHRKRIRSMCNGSGVGLSDGKCWPSPLFSLSLSQICLVLLDPSMMLYVPLYVMMVASHTY